MAERVQAILVLILWASLARQLAVVHWRPRTVEQRGTCVAIGLFALAMTLLFPPVYLFVDRLTSTPNFSRLLANCLGMTSGWAIAPVRLRALRRQDRPGPLGSGWVLLGAIAAETIFFFSAHTRESIPGNFAERYAALDTILAYRVILMAYVGTVMAQLCWAGWQHRALTRTIQQRYRRLHSQLQTLGWGCGAAYALHEALLPLLERFKLALPVGVHTAVEYTLLSGFVLLLLGSGFITFGHWLVLYRTYRRLYILWRDLRRLVPNIVNNSSFPPANSLLADLLTLSELESRRYSRVTEMQDGLLALRRYATSVVVTHALWLGQRAALRPDDLEALGDAAIVTAAVHAPDTAALAGSAPTYEARGSADLDRELQHFLRVARLYRRSRILRLSLTYARRAGATAPATAASR
jgi:hypothetical protein